MRTGKHAAERLEDGIMMRVKWLEERHGTLGIKKFKQCPQNKIASGASLLPKIVPGQLR